MTLWRLDLSVPAFYWSDSLYNCALVGALAKGTWKYHIVRVGGPLRKYGPWFACLGFVRRVVFVDGVLVCQLDDA